MDLEKMGKFIAKLRVDKGLTQAQLGELLGVENKIISKWEKGTTTPDVMMLIALSNVFNVRVEEIVDGEYIEKYKTEKVNKEEIKINEKNINKDSNKIKNIIICILSIILLVTLGLFAYEEIKNNKKANADIVTIDLKNDLETPLNVNGCIMNSNNSAMYVIKGISYETKGEDKIGKTLIVQYEVKLLVDDKMIGTYTHNFDTNKPLDDAIDNLAFTVESGVHFDTNSKVKIQIKYTTLSSDKEIIETDLYV